MPHHSHLATQLEAGSHLCPYLNCIPADRRPERRPRGECDVSPEKVGLQSPRRGASSCWLQTGPRNNPITLGSLVSAPLCASCWGPGGMPSLPPGRGFTEEMSPWSPGQGRQVQPEVWGPLWAQMDREERLPRLQGQGDLACWKGQHSRRTEVCGQRFGVVPGKRHALSRKTSGLFWPRQPQLSMPSGHGVQQMAGGGRGHLRPSQARPSGPHRLEPETLAPATRSSRLES